MKEQCRKEMQWGSRMEVIPQEEMECEGEEGELDKLSGWPGPYLDIEHGRIQRGIPESGFIPPSR